MEDLGFLQKPVKPATIEPLFQQFFEGTSLVYPRIVCELSPFNEGEYDRILQAGEDRPYTVEREGIASHKILRHSYAVGYIFGVRAVRARSLCLVRGEFSDCRGRGCYA
jgi:hypothetical protein